MSAFTSVGALKSAIRGDVFKDTKGYTLEKVTTSAHGTYWVMVAPDGLRFGPRMFDEAEAQHELSEYVAYKEGS